MLTPSQGMVVIAAGAPPRDIKGPPPRPRTVADSGTRREAQIPARRDMDNQGEGHDYYGTLQLHGLQPRLPEVRTPGR